MYKNVIWKISKVWKIILISYSLTKARHIIGKVEKSLNFETDLPTN